MNFNLFPQSPILIVDDEKQTLKSLKIVFDLNQINNVICCEDSRKILPLLKKRDVSLILLDLCMPYLSGEELIHKINNNFPHIPVIVITGINEVETAVGCMKSGSFDYIVKPIDEAVLISTVKRGLKLQALNQENSLLKKSLAIAKEANRLKSAFLSVISHEIRTPLNAIMGFIDLALRSELSSKNREYLQIVKKNGDLLLEIISNILELSKIEAGQMKLEKIPCSIDTILNDVMYNAEKLIFQQGKNISVRQKLFDDKLSLMLSDPKKIQQIINSLASNAVKFTKEGFIEYAVYLKNRHMLEVYVKDTGIGIPKYKQEQIFNSFQQGDMGNTRKYRGLGIGLTLAMKLVDLMGGELKFESEIGKKHGSTFFFTLPYAPANLSIDKVGRDRRSTKKIKGLKKDYTVLLAEDSITSQRLIQIMLDKVGYKIVIAVDGIEAVNIYKLEPDIDIILMDIGMPELDGIEATKKIRSIEKEEKRHKVPIIALTAFDIESSRENCFKAGCDDLIIKPFNQDRLVEKIKLYLQKAA
ncbi:response regulator [Candidatus Auribacterota bacterium]